MTDLPPDLMLLSEAARRLGISVSAAYRAAKAGRLPGAIKVGGAWRVSIPRFDREVHGTAAAQ